jgi:hypothetical protein
MFAALQLLSIVVSMSSLALVVCIVLASRQPVQSRSVWCEPRQRHTTVKFVERRQSGMVTRCVRDCPLRKAGERCSEICMKPFCV